MDTEIWPLLKDSLFTCLPSTEAYQQLVEVLPVPQREESAPGCDEAYTSQQLGQGFPLVDWLSAEGGRAGVQPNGETNQSGVLGFCYNGCKFEVFRHIKSHIKL